MKCETIIRILFGGLGITMLLGAFAYMLMGVDVVYGPWRKRR